MRRKSVTALLVGMVALGTVALPAGATAATGSLAATCAVDIYTNGDPAPRFEIAGTFQITGNAPATARVDEPLVFTDVRVRLAVDWAALRPEMESRDVTDLSGELMAAWFDRTNNGEPDWPVSVKGQYASFPVEQLGTGIETIPQDQTVHPAVEPGTVEWANYGDVYVAVRKLTDPQVAVFFKCTPTPGQDQSYGVTTVLP